MDRLCAALWVAEEAYTREAIGCPAAPAPMPAEARPCRVEDGADELTARYDDAGRLVEVRYRVGKGEGFDATWTYEYGADNALTSIVRKEFLPEGRASSSPFGPLQPEVTQLSREGPRTCVRSSRRNDSPTVYGGQPERVERALCYVQADGGVQRIEYERPGGAPTVTQIFERQGGRVIGSAMPQGEGVVRSTLRWDARGRPVELLVDNPDPDALDVRSRFIWDERDRVTDMFEAFADGDERRWTIRYECG